MYARLSHSLAQLERRVEALEASETLRVAEHATMLDRLERLYRRLSARITRAAQLEPDSNGESPLDLKRRLGK